MQNHNRDMEYERENYGEDLYDDGYDDDEGHEEDEPAEPIIDRSTPAGKLMYNLYKRENDRKKLINIGKAHAPKPRAEPRKSEKFQSGSMTVDAQALFKPLRSPSQRRRESLSPSSVQSRTMSFIPSILSRH